MSYQVNIEPSPVDYVPRRVVSLVPSLTESFFDLDLGDRLIAITDACTHPPARVQALPKLGPPEAPGLAHISALEPDLVVVDDAFNRPADIAALEEAGLPIWVTGPRTVFDTLNLLWSIMDIFDHAVMIPRVREIERAYDYTAGAARAKEPVAVAALTGRWQSFNQATYAHDILQVCGGHNVFATREENTFAVTLDEIAAARPAIVLLADTFNATDRAAVETLGAAVHSIEERYLTWPGTRVGFALRDLPGLLMRGEE